MWCTRCATTKGRRSTRSLDRSTPASSLLSKRCSPSWASRNPTRLYSPRPVGSHGGRVAVLVALLVGAIALLNAAPAIAQSSSSSTSSSSESSSSSSASTQPTATAGTIPEGKEGVQGLLIDKKGTADLKDDEPIGGVTVTIKDASGKEVGSAVTDKNGRFTVVLPAAGKYTAVLDTSKLPSGVSVSDADTTREFAINPTQVKPVNFRVNVVKPPSVTLAHRLAQAAVNGINFGLIIALASVGLSLIYVTTRLVNFAHGEIVTLGALLAFYFNNTLGWSLLVGAPIALVLTALFGAGLDTGLWGPLRRRGAGLISMLVISIGLSLALKNVYLYIFGGLPRSYQSFNIQKAYEVGGIDIAPRNLASSIISVIALVAVAIGLQRTRMGKAMRAIADNRDLASSSGINVDRVIRLVWFFGSGLAALGGIFFGLTESAVSFEEGSTLLLLMFAAITLGGLGTAFGALAGGFVIGLFVDVSTVWVPPE